jgi:hypothetical protein
MQLSIIILVRNLKCAMFSKKSIHVRTCHNGEGMGEERERLWRREKREREGEKYREEREK